MKRNSDCTRARMEQRARLLALTLIASLALLFAWGWRSPGRVFAQGGDYRILWWTLDGGGGRSEAGPYTLHATIGQWDASTTQQAGDFRLTGGFWALPQNAPGGEEPPPPPANNAIYLPKVHTN